jgi:hypothetical protein
MPGTVVVPIPDDLLPDRVPAGLCGSFGLVSATAGGNEKALAGFLIECGGVH